MAFHPQHRVILVVIFLELLLVVQVVVDRMIQDKLIVVETEIYAHQHLEIPLIHMVDLALLILLFTSQVAVEEVDIKEMELPVVLAAEDLAATLQVNPTLKLAIMDIPTPEEVEVVEHLTVVDPLVMEEVV